MTPLAASRNWVHDERPRTTLSTDWTTQGKVIEADPSRAFTFECSAGDVHHTTWGYRIEATDGGCRVTEWNTADQTRIRFFLATPGVIGALSVSLDGTTIAVSGQDDLIDLYLSSLGVACAEVAGGGFGGGRVREDLDLGGRSAPPCRGPVA
jgi:hypothetical protein